MFRSSCDLNPANCANVHNTARWRCGGQSVKCGRSSHSSGTHRGSVRSMIASLFFVHFHWYRPSPHSTRWWSKMSFLTQRRQFSVGTIRILWRRSFVGTISCIIFYSYHVVFVESVTGAVHRFFHILGHSTRVVPKLMPPIYFHGNYTRYKEHNNTI